MKKILVWDWPVRVFHWSLVVCFAGAWLTAESEKLKLVHLAFGYSAAALIVFRIVWGMIGTRYARWSQFIKGPTVVKNYLNTFLNQQDKKHYLGHNPAGAWVMVLLMSLIVLVVGTGYLSYKEIVGEWGSEIHETLASIMLAVVGVHVTAAIVMSMMNKENLIRSMITGTKLGQSENAIQSSWLWLGVLLAIFIGWLFWKIYTGGFPALTL